MRDFTYTVQVHKNKRSVKKMGKHKLDYMFDPASVAVIGASKSKEKWGASVLRHIIQGGYGGEIYPINPKEEKIQKLKVYPSITETPQPPDLAIVATPNKTIPSIIEECTEKGVETAVIISSGFGEASEDKKELEKEITRKARDGGLRFAGPNCMGIYSSKADLCALMPPVQPIPGKISFISQSGNLGVQTLDRGTQSSIGFDMFISSGNEADLTCEDYIEYFRKKNSTESVLAYIEGIEDGQKFLNATKKAVLQKPVIVYKAGETEAGKAAAASHTGKMAGSKKIHDGIFKQAGIIEAELTEDMLRYAMAFNQPLPENNKVAIVTRGGGWGVVAADACQKHGLEIPQLPEELVEELDEFLPSYWSRGNPIDSVASTDPKVHFKILEAVEGWDVGGVIVMGGIGKHFIDGAVDKGYPREPVVEYRTKYVEKMTDLSETKTVFAVVFEVMDDTKPVKILRDNQIPVYSDPDTAVKSYSKLVEYKNFLDNAKNSS